MIHIILSYLHVVNCSLLIPLFESFKTQTTNRDSSQNSVKFR